MPLTSRSEPVRIPDVSITDYVLRRAAEVADKPAFIDGTTGARVTYLALEQQIRSLAGGLQARGVGPGTTWALMAPNRAEYAVVFHGLALCGATVTTLNPTYGAHEIAFQLRDSGASALVTVEAFLDTARAAATEAGVQTLIVVGPGDAEPLSDWMGTPLAAQVPVPLSEHVVALPYSSGTTGFPKGVMLTHRNLVANLVQSSDALGVSDDDVVFAALPFFHIYGMTVLMNLTLAEGSTAVTVPRFDLVQMLELTQQHRITRLFVVPPIVLALAKHPIIDRYDLSSVTQIFSGAAPLGAELGRAAAARIGCGIAQGYGMTELSPVSHATYPGDDRPGSVGRLVPSTEARIVGEDGRDVPQGSRGELWIRGPQVMKGYLNNPEATAATIDPDGWLHTGDVATVDDDGFFAIVDRLKELIKVNGFQVPPAELEALIITLPGVADVAVIGVPDEAAGERVKAFVVRGEGAALTEGSVQEFVRERVVSYKQVQIVEFVDSIPKSASGKILRRELRDRTS
jgi:acyl-CoA synthetase (AMP-forming)/AMP-acid ligase II